MTAYTNATIFTGTTFLEDHIVLVHENTIVLVAPPESLPADATVIDCGGDLLVPAFIDLQVYGAGGLLLSAYPTASSLAELAEHNAANGTAFCMATIATQTIENIYACIDAIKSYWRQGGRGILGMHLEGPFINALKRGAHIEEWIHAPTEDEITKLLEHAAGTIKIVTLAPEIVSESVIQLFRSKGIVVSLGHSNASFETARQALNNGATTVTHLFNAMSPLHHREPGLPAAAMLHASAFASIVADGIHVHFDTVKMAKKLMGERLFFITDAVTETSIGPYRHQLDIDHYNLPNGTLSGSALTMLQAIRNSVQHCDIPLAEALRMASLYPAKVMGFDTRLGKIEKGFAASLALVKKDLSSAVLV